MRAVVVERVSLRNFRSYAALDLDLAPGLVLVTGANGVGKTNLLEALHVGSQGFSPRTRAETQLVRFGAGAARVALAGAEGASAVETDVVLRPRDGKRVMMNGAPLATVDELRTRLSALVFLPDRLAVVKGGPLVRRRFFDRMLGRLFPVDGQLPVEYGRALAQRNYALRRARAGLSTRAAVAPWTRSVAELGSELERARGEIVALLAPRFAAAAERLGLSGATLEYERQGVSVEELESRYEQDVVRGGTSVGPHLGDVRIVAACRDLRSFGSQGEQRAAVLALVLAEACLLVERRGTPPLLLLDDVLSEFDEERRSALVSALPSGAQTVVTATSTRALPGDLDRPALVVEVTPGAARAG